MLISKIAVFCFLFFSFPSFENYRKTVLDDSFASDLTLYDSVQQNKFVEFANPSNSTIPDAPINTNFVNYQLDNKQTRFEIFDENKYSKRDTIPGNSKSDDFVANGIAIYANNDWPIQHIGDAKQSPYLPTAKILMTYYNVYNNATKKYETMRYTGTAFLEGPNLAVTAGHCMYGDVTNDGEYQDNKNNPRFPDVVEFYFGCSDNDDIELGADYSYYARAKTISIEYDYYQNESWEHDWSAVVLDRNIGKKTSWYGKIDTSFSEFRNNKYPVYSWGYPANKARGTLWRADGTIQKYTEYKFYYDLNTYGGQSGSPIFVDYPDGNTYVCGIHTSSYTDAATFKYNSGTLFNSLIFSYLNSFFVGEEEDNQECSYLKLSTDSLDNTKSIHIINDSSHIREIEYNTKLCMPDDAKNWTGLKDIQKTVLKPYTSLNVSIANNWFASTVAVSFCFGKYRYITYWYHFNDEPVYYSRVVLKNA